MNWIQNHIIVELIRHQSRRYSELRPRDIEGNLFMYHLKGLIKMGLVEKYEKDYRLTSAGLQLVSRISLMTGKPRIQPKIVTAIIAKNDEGDYLLIKWKRQPNIGKVSLPYGMVHVGESIFDMAKRELAEKTGLEGEIVHRGDIYVRGIPHEKHMLVHLFEASNLQIGQKTKLRSELCDHFWASFADIPKTQWVPGFYEIVEQSRQGLAALQEIVVEM